MCDFNDSVNRFEADNTLLHRYRFKYAKERTVQYTGNSSFSFSKKSEAFDLEFLENPEEVFPSYWQ